MLRMLEYPENVKCYTKKEYKKFQTNFEMYIKLPV